MFQFTDYRAFLLAQLGQGTAISGKRGFKAALSRHLKIHSSLLGKILKGEKEFTPDHAFHTAQFFELDELESEYFIQLVHHSRSGTKAYRERIARQLLELKSKAGYSDPSLESNPALTQEQQLAYYSQWYFSALSLLTTIDYFNGSDFVRRATEALGLSESTVREALAFLVNAGVCRREGDRWKLLKPMIQISGETGLVDRHLVNWRIQAMERIHRPVGSAYFQTYPVALSRQAAAEAKALLKDAYKRIVELTGKDTPEALYCLNLDWFDVLCS